MAQKKKEFIAFAICICMLFILFCVIYSFVFPSNELLNEENGYIIYKHRKIFAYNLNLSSDSHLDTNCTPPDIEQFPRPLIDYETRRKGGLILHIFVSLYMFLGLAIICDEYFVPSLEKICKVFDIQSDVAGATFMAAGSSAPELATAIIAVFIAKDDIGIGTVVGSAVFNIAFVIGVCGLFAGHVIYLNWWPMVRDCIFYLISILALLFALRDETVTWVESVLFLTLYVMYIVFMFFNRRIEKWFSKFNCLSKSGPSNTELANEITYRPLPDLAKDTSENNIAENFVDTSDYMPDLENSLSPAENIQDSNIKSPSGACRKCLWAVSLPFLVVCYLTIPDCRKSNWEKWFLLTFLSSCVWIGILSYILVWMITIIGFTLNIRDTIMGLTFLAAGASIPDMISSLLVVRDGYGDMAISNAVGSNVFDILLCLGFPWFLQTVIVEPGSKIIVKSRGLIYSTLTLLLTIIFLIFATHLNRWKLDKKYGAILLAWYLLFMVVAIVYELTIGGDTTPTCPSDF